MLPSTGAGAVVSGVVELLPPPYPYDALEPVLSADTVRIHYTRHHLKYWQRLTELLGPNELQSMTFVELLDQAPRGSDIYNLASQVRNHNLYWQSLSPTPVAPSPIVQSVIGGYFGGYERFRRDFIELGMSEFGSGWLWLAGWNGGVRMMTCHDADGPRADRPLLAIDLWEHAYYLDYPGLRAQYLGGVLDRLNWRTFEARLTEP